MSPLCGSSGSNFSLTDLWKVNKLLEPRNNLAIHSNSSLQNSNTQKGKFYISPTPSPQVKSISHLTQSIF